MDTEARSVIFSWSRDEAESLLRYCDDDGVFPIVQEFVPRGALVLESGCGLGRYVRYLTDRGWPCVGLEYSSETVRALHEIWPDLAVVQGDVADSPFKSDAFDAIISLGVVEHFQDGFQPGLGEIRRLLKPGGIAIITVPCLNTVRKIKRWIGWDEAFTLPRALAARIVKGTPKPWTRLNPAYLYPVYPTYGPFFEYRVTPEQFAYEVNRAGLRILDHRPHSMIDGIYHELNPFKLLIRYRDWRFHPTKLGRWLHELLLPHEFFCCHMQAIIATKDTKDAVG